MKPVVKFGIGAAVGLFAILLLAGDSKADVPKKVAPPLPPGPPTPSTPPTPAGPPPPVLPKPPTLIGDKMAIVTTPSPLMREYGDSELVNPRVPTLPPGVVVKVMAIGYQLPGQDEWSQVVLHAPTAFALGFDNGGFVGPNPDDAEFEGDDVVGYVLSRTLSMPQTWTPATF